MKRNLAGSVKVASGGNNDILEQYLAETLDLRKEPAVLLFSENGARPTYRTLDGTRVFPFWELVEVTGCNPTELRQQLERGAVAGIQIGDMWYAAKEAVTGHSRCD